MSGSEKPSTKFEAAKSMLETRFASIAPPSTTGWAPAVSNCDIKFKRPSHPLHCGDIVAKRSRVLFANLPPRSAKGSRAWATSSKTRRRWPLSPPLAKTASRTAASSESASDGRPAKAPSVVATSVRLMKAHTCVVFGVSKVHSWSVARRPPVALLSTHLPLRRFATKPPGENFHRWSVDSRSSLQSHGEVPMAAPSSHPGSPATSRHRLPVVLRM
mmetsp:Transcript_121871/g.351864  ORF Transcript_121871/g.351864 Transcript_121871/m.351864 type:complete len:216 (+) Transcript_121871:2173-2820(+)